LCPRRADEKLVQHSTLLPTTRTRPARYRIGRAIATPGARGRNCRLRFADAGRLALRFVPPDYWPRFALRLGARNPAVDATRLGPIVLRSFSAYPERLALCRYRRRAVSALAGSLRLLEACPGLEPVKIRRRHGRNFVAAHRPWLSRLHGVIHQPAMRLQVTIDERQID